LVSLRRFSPVFTYAPNYWDDQKLENSTEVLAQPLSFFQAISTVIMQPKRKPSQCRPLDVILKDSKKNSSGPVVFFPEGTTTNGSVFLDCPKFSKNSANLDLSEVHILAFSYDSLPVYTVGSFLMHLLRLCTRFSNHMEVKYVFEQDIQSIVETNERSREDKLLSFLASCNGIKRGKISACPKHEFIDYWYNHTKSYVREK